MTLTLYWHYIDIKIILTLLYWNLPGQWRLLCYCLRPGPSVLGDLRELPRDLLLQEVQWAQGPLRLDIQKVSVWRWRWQLSSRCVVLYLYSSLFSSSAGWKLISRKYRLFLCFVILFKALRDNHYSFAEDIKDKPWYNDEAQS